ncbi:FeoA family protein [Halanaerobium salsuginis]|uniref:Ferrous iron transport protein A n=1 Tax=Halanaerobium salsuginis TaxID=29563 RepID=A0A1I4L8X7_9FIRM|nr:FeoA family protein [Halanaerobium salsuginis]SFL87462.1 ferrous iron transport protein A [Halanaerobium salsuginis]
MEKISLNKLKPGDQGKIVNIFLQGASGRRLMDLGFIPGNEFTVVRNAPLVDPVELEIKDSNISIRHEEARYIEVVVNG